MRTDQDDFSVSASPSYQPVAQSRFGSHALSKSPGQGLDEAADQGDFGVCETGWYVARCLEVEVASQGHSVEEALVNLKEALELYFEDAPPVEASHPIVAPVEIRVPA